MEYVSYMGLIYNFRKETKKEKIRVNAGEMLKNSINQMALLGRNADMFTAVTEYLHYLISHRVIMVPKALGEALGRSNVEFELKDLRLPYSVFEVVFEGGLMMPNGVQMPGLLVMAKPSEAAIDVMGEILGSASAFRIDRGQQRRMFSVRYGDERGTIYTANIDYELTGGKSIRDVVFGMPLLRGVDCGLTEEEKVLEVYIMKVLMGVLAYMSLDDAEIEVCKVRNRPRMGVEVNGVVLGRGYKHEVGGHLRSGHFRRLMDERFRRGVDGRVRVVWVRECVVGDLGTVIS